MEGTGQQAGPAHACSRQTARPTSSALTGSRGNRVSSQAEGDAVQALLPKVKQLALACNAMNVNSGLIGFWVWRVHDPFCQQQRRPAAAAVVQWQQRQRRQRSAGGDTPVNMQQQL